MKKLITLLIAFLAFQNVGFCQKTKSKKNKASKVMILQDSLRWKKEHYAINRDFACNDPRIAIKKLAGGNKRFLERKSIKPRQNLETLKKLEDGQYPFATIVGCSNFRAGNTLNNAVRQNAIEQLNNLRNLEPIVHKKYAAGEILIVGAYIIFISEKSILRRNVVELT